MLRLFATISLLALALGIMSCGGGNPTPPPPPVFISVSVSPQTTTVVQSGTFTFAGTVTGTANLAISWSIQEGAAGGAITSAGVYTAPASAGTFHVVATSQADPSKSSTATVTVSAISVSVSPVNPLVPPKGTQLFSALVTGTINTSVTWSVLEGAAGGTINASGLYTAPAALGTYHVVATSLADSKVSASTAVTVPPVSIAISPTKEILGPGSTRLFTAVVVGLVDSSVTWRIQEAPMGGALTSTGQYTAPSTTGTYHIIATSISDTSQSASATVTVVSSGFTSTGSMNEVRSGATATLLSGGKVLIIGGVGLCDYGCAVFASAELYDPASGIFSPSGSMAIGRDGHTATLLANGKILVTGGTDFSGAPSATAELYDPATGNFVSAGSMANPRGCHTATLLPNGKVLIAGGGCGSSSSNISRTAELYDPVSGAFTATGSMVSPRVAHTATLLANGRILVAGGETVDAFATATAELYDPATGSFTATGVMKAARANHTATLLLDGRVLVAGGADFGAEIFDPGKGTFSDAGNFNTPRNKQTATLLPGGKVLFAGGIDALKGSGSLQSAEVYDPASSTFTLVGDMATARQFHTATLLPSGAVLVAGGSNNVSAELYH